MITLQRLMEALEYDAETGIFCWRGCTKNGRGGVGVIAGKINRKGYRMIGIDGCDHQAHRLAWLYVRGEWPGGQIDHKNGDRSDNRIENLRIATPSQNGANKKTLRSGLKGATKFRKKWQSQIRIAGRVVYLGLFETEHEAHEAYAQAALAYHGEFARAE